MYPTTSPDGRNIAFSTDRDGNLDIWKMDLETKSTEAFITGGSADTHPAWSPDGSRLYFASDRSGAFNIWMRRTDGKTPEQVTFYHGHSFGLPEVELFTRFAVASSKIVLPLEHRQGSIHLLELPGEE